MSRERIDIEDPALCGIGEGERCCAYMAVDGGGIHCVKVEPGLKAIVDQRVASGQFVARIQPVTAFPECQPERAALAGVASAEPTTEDQT